MAIPFRPFKLTKPFDSLDTRLERMDNSKKCGKGWIPDGSKCHSGETKRAPKAGKTIDELPQGPPQPVKLKPHQAASMSPAQQLGAAQNLQIATDLGLNDLSPVGGPKGGPPEFESREQKGDFYRAKMAAQEAAAHGGYDGKKPVPPPTSDPKGGAPEFVSREHKAAFYREKMAAQKAGAPAKPFDKAAFKKKMAI